LKIDIGPWVSQGLYRHYNYY